MTGQRWVRKRRTRQRIIADQSVNCVQKFIIDAGFTSEVTTKDYGYDLTVNTFDEHGLVEQGNFYIQLKASETLTPHSDGFSYVFDLDRRDFNLWKNEPMPVFLVLYEAFPRRAYGLYFQRSLAREITRKPRDTARTVRVRIPKSHRVGKNFLRYARNRKSDILWQLSGKISHA